MHEGYTLFTKEWCGETVIVRTLFGTLDYDSDSQYRNDLADFMLRQDMQIGEIKLFRGTYDPKSTPKFSGKITEIAFADVFKLGVK